MKKPKKTKLSPSKSKYKGIKKSRSNTSGRSGKAKVEGEKKTQAARRRAAGKKTKPTASKQRVAKGLPFKRSALNPRNPTQLPETDLTKKGLTLRKLIRGTPRLMINNAHDVDVVSLEKTFTVSGMPAIQSVTLTSDPWRPNKIKRPHDTFIIGLDRDADNNPDIKTPINKHKRVICSCACENYVYTWEYANALHGASRIIYGNGDAPTMTNPQNAYGLCKHLVALSLKVIKANK